jgi:hypothetical protein
MDIGIVVGLLTVATWSVPPIEEIGRQIREAWREGAPAANLRVIARFELVVEQPDEALGDAYFPNRSTPVGTRTTQRRSAPQPLWFEDASTKGKKHRNDVHFPIGDAQAELPPPQGLDLVKVFDGQDSWSFLRPSRNVERIPGDSPMVGSGLGYYRDMIGLPLKPIGSRATAGDSTEPYRLDELIPSGKYAVEGEAVVEGEPCVVLARPGIDRLWIAKDRGWAIVRREWYWSAGGPLKRRFVNRDFREVAPGVWIPYVASMEIHGKAGAKVGTLKATVLDAVADVPDDWFKPDFPKGTRINDRETGEVTIFGEPPPSPEEAARLGIGPMFYPPPWWQRPLTLWPGGVALALLVIAGVRRWISDRMEADQ